MRTAVGHLLPGHVPQERSGSHVVEPSPRGTSSRTVTRTAVHAAWAVPVIQVAAAAPAFAAASLSISVRGAIDGPHGKLFASAIDADIEGGPTQNLQVTVFFPEQYAADDQSFSVTVTNDPEANIDAWDASDVVYSATDPSRFAYVTFTLQSGDAATGDGPGESLRRRLRFLFTTTDDLAAPFAPLTAVVTATGHTSEPAAIPLDVPGFM